MPPPPPPAPTLICKDCGYSNEPERVYCHNCGAKLDRSVLPRDENVKREDPERARRRLIRMTNPDSNQFQILALGTIKAILAAIPAAAFILLVLAPDGVPADKHEMQTRFPNMELEELVDASQPHTTSFSEAEINAFLASGKIKANSLIPGVAYHRSFVNLTPGSCRITIEKTVFGYSLYFGTLHRVEAASGVLSTTNIGGNIGRLPIHPLLMRYLDMVLYTDLATSLKREYTELKKLQALHIEKGKVILTGRGAVKK